MSYGISIKNADGYTILDNNPISVLHVVETGTLASGFTLENVIDVTNKTFMFVRPTTQGQNIYGDKYYSRSGANVYLGKTKLYASSGTISYVKIKESTDVSVSGFGLAIYDTQATPKLVFNDALKNARVLYNIYTNLSSDITLSLPDSFTGQHKYLNATAFLGVQTGGSTATFAKFYTGTGDSTAYIVRRNISSYAANTNAIYQYMTIIEC